MIGELETVLARVKSVWGGLDFLLHAIAFVPKAALQGRVTDFSEEGFDIDALLGAAAAHTPDHHPRVESPER